MKIGSFRVRGEEEDPEKHLRGMDRMIADQECLHIDKKRHVEHNAGSAGKATMYPITADMNVKLLATRVDNVVTRLNFVVVRRNLATKSVPKLHVQFYQR